MRFLLERVSVSPTEIYVIEGDVLDDALTKFIYNNPNAVIGEYIISEVVKSMGHYRINARATPCEDIPF